jgi:hypothetical protein
MMTIYSHRHREGRRPAAIHTTRGNCHRVPGRDRRMDCRVAALLAMTEGVWIVGRAVLAMTTPPRHREGRSPAAIQTALRMAPALRVAGLLRGLPRRCAPRNDAGRVVFFCPLSSVLCLLSPVSCPPTRRAAALLAMTNAKCCAHPFVNLLRQGVPVMLDWMKARYSTSSRGILPLFQDQSWIYPLSGLSLPIRKLIETSFDTEFTKIRRTRRNPKKGNVFFSVSKEFLFSLESKPS